MSSKLAYVLWSWLTTFAFAALLYWLATVSNFDVSSDISNEIIKVIFRMILYTIFFILFYRSVIATLKTTVKRLSSWRSKGEMTEDAEFVLIIETLVVIISVLAVSLFAIFEEGVQAYTAGRHAELKDILISIMATLLAALIVYSMPVIGELEVAVVHKFQKERNKKRTKKENS